MTRKQKREEERLTATAYHEAGHAVARMAYGRRFEHVTIAPEGDNLGCLMVGLRIAKAEIRRRERNGERGYIDFGSLVESCAGPIAEKEITGKYNHVGARSDYEANGALVGERALFCNWVGYHPRVPPKTPNQLWAAAHGEAAAILDLAWPSVEAIAKALLTKTTLTYDEALEIKQEAARSSLRGRLGRRCP